MEKPQYKIREIYFGLVCLITLVIMVFGGVKFVGSVIDLVVQPLPIYPTLEEAALRFKEAKKQNPELNWEEFRQQVEEEREYNRKAEQARRWREVGTGIAMVLIPLPIYYFHWRSFRKEKLCSGQDG